MLSQYPYYTLIGLKKSAYTNGKFIPKRSQKIKNKRLRAKNKKRR